MKCEMMIKAFAKTRNKPATTVGSREINKTSGSARNMIRIESKLYMCVHFYACVKRPIKCQIVLPSVSHFSSCLKPVDNCAKKTPNVQKTFQQQSRVIK